MWTSLRRASSFEQFLEPAEAAFNPSSPDTDGEGYYAPVHGRLSPMKHVARGEAANGSTWGAYQEPSDPT